VGGGGGGRVGVGVWVGVGGWVGGCREREIERARKGGKQRHIFEKTS